MEKLHYDFTIEQLVKQILEPFSERSDLELVMDYYHYHNNICPRCRTEMKVYNGEVKNVGTVGLAVLLFIGKYAPYVVCKKCTNSIIREPKFIQQKKAQELEDYMGTVVESLKV